MKRTSVTALVVVVSVSMFLSACSSGPKAPSDNDFIKTFTTQVTGIANVKVLGKTHCETVSDQAKALGATNVWLVGFEYDITSTGEHRKTTDTLFESGGAWKLGDFALNLSSEKCP